jgi:hypothetical protein
MLFHGVDNANFNKMFDAAGPVPQWADIFSLFRPSWWWLLRFVSSP